MEPHDVAERAHQMCFFPSKITMGGVWIGDNPLDFSIPLLLFQILLITSTTRAATLLLSPLRLPTYISQLLAGFLLGPSALGRLPHFSDLLFPIRSLFVLESMALLGLIYYTFIVGVEIKVPTITRAGLRSFWFAAGCALPPFLIGAVTGYVALSTDDSRNNKAEFLNRLSFPIFLGATFSSTAFSVLARNIAELKLAGTDVGRLTLSASLINDTFAWAGLTVATALGHARCSLLQTTWTLTSGVAIFGASYLLLRPMLLRLAALAADDECRGGCWVLIGVMVGEGRECWVLIGVMVAALAADAGGTHAIFGAFVFGLAVPNGPVGVALVEKVEDFVVGTLLPLFFDLSGLRSTSSSSPAARRRCSVGARRAQPHGDAVQAHLSRVRGVRGVPRGGGGWNLGADHGRRVAIRDNARGHHLRGGEQALGAHHPPLHKHHSVNGGMEVSHPAIQPLNGSVQRFSPCTVGILVDRDLAAVPVSGSYRMAALFFGGSDDREVVALATRMAKNPAIDLTVLRFVQKGGGSCTAGEFDALKERKADEGCLREFLDRANEGGGATVEYRERGVFNAGEMVGEIQSVEAMGNRDLFVVGKTPGAAALTAGMAEWSECPELGPIGDLLASKDLNTTASVLVLQAYGRPAVVGAVSVDFGGGDSVAPTERSASGRRPWTRPGI